MGTLAAVASRPTHHSARPDWQFDFLDLPPGIERRVRLAFRELGPAARGEAVQDATCAACRAYVRLAAAGRADAATAASLAKYAAAQYRSGRRAGSSRNVNDICSEYCRLRRDVRVERLDMADDDSWREVLVEDRTVTPAELAASRIDYPAFLAGLPAKARRVAEALAAGESTTGAARLFGLSAGRVSQLRRELCDAWCRFHGECGPALPAAA